MKAHAEDPRPRTRADNPDGDAPPPTGRALAASLQRLLESLYGIRSPARVEDFVVDAVSLASIAPAMLELARSAKELLLVAQEGDSLDIALYLDPADLDGVASEGPAPWASFLRLLEGVSHFLYLAWHGGRDRPVSALELELQAEVDKFVTLALFGGANDVRELWHRLFRNPRYRGDLSAEERQRYQVALAMAARFTRRLLRRYLRSGRREQMVRSLRRFYRLPRAEKYSVAQAA